MVFLRYQGKQKVICLNSLILESEFRDDPLGDMYFKNFPQEMMQTK